jgi:hypothetical protein
VKEVVMTVTSTPTPARPSTHHRPAKRPPPAVRRFGYLVAASVNAAMLYAVNAWPGWDALPFLTSETGQVLTAVNASIVAGIVVNLVYLGHDPRWLRGLGDMVTTAFSLAALLRIWEVFPFYFSGDGLDWALLVRVLLVLGVVGTAIGFVTGLIAFVRNLPTRR